MTHEEQTDFWFKTVQDTDRINKRNEQEFIVTKENEAKKWAEYLKGREQNEKDNERFRGLMDRLEKFLDRQDLINKHTLL